jgi:hypothetical protein
MKHAVEMDSYGMTYISSFIKIGRGVNVKVSPPKFEGL